MSLVNHNPKSHGSEVIRQRVNVDGDASTSLALSNPASWKAIVNMIRAERNECDGVENTIAWATSVADNNGLFLTEL